MAVKQASCEDRRDADRLRGNRIFSDHAVGAQVKELGITSLLNSMQDEKVDLFSCRVETNALRLGRAYFWRSIIESRYCGERQQRDDAMHAIPN